MNEEGTGVSMFSKAASSSSSSWWRLVGEFWLSKVEFAYPFTSL